MPTVPEPFGRWSSRTPTAKKAALEKDIVTTLTFFGKWYARHKETCGVGVERLDVLAERHEGAWRFQLACPICANNTSGLIRNEDMHTLVTLLDENKQSKNVDPFKPLS